MPEALIESLDYEGRGVAHVDGKTVFVDGALPLERVVFESFRRKPNYELAAMQQVLVASPQRVAARCRHFGVCGGCSMQHFDAAGQAAAKQRVLEDALWHIGRIRPDVIYPAIHGPAWAYRRRARFSVRLVKNKGGVLVGFHEKRSSFVAEMDSCETLPTRISDLIVPLRELIGGLSIANRLPQIEIAIGDAVTVLVMRVLQATTERDEARLRNFADAHGFHLWLQAGGPDSARPFHPLDAPGLSYALPEFGVEFDFSPTDFTQVNHDMNRVLVRRALALLDPRPGDRIADLFCGLGNFTLPIARRGAVVLGVEGNRTLVERARANAETNGLAERASFLVANLFDATPESIARLGRVDKVLIDPPREGAVALAKAFGDDAPRGIVYVSCNPATLARDAAVLVHEKGYMLAGAGIVNMFPQTSHVESIALLERRHQ